MFRRVKLIKICEKLYLSIWSFSILKNGPVVHNREGLVDDVGGCLWHINHEMTEFLILGDVRRAVSKTTTLNFWKEDFDLLRKLVGRVL